jgi:hypothetical protein
LLGVKVPPFVKVRISMRADGGSIFEFDQEWIPLGLQVLREPALSWVLEGITIDAPQATTW